jgi:hypothetical protein
MGDTRQLSTTTRLVASALLAGALALVGCGGDEASDARTTPRRSDRTLPRMRGLPTLPMPFDTSTATFQRLWENVNEALEMPFPEPVIRSEAAYRRWVEGTLADWLTERAEAIDEALVRQRALVESSSTERIVSHALVAWLCERTADDVLAADVPELDEARARLFREAWRERMEPVAERAREHWAACVELGSGSSIETQAWVELCRDHEHGVAPALRGADDTDADQDLP